MEGRVEIAVSPNHGLCESYCSVSCHLGKKCSISKMKLTTLRW
jgi:hypothetical protein